MKFTKSQINVDLTNLKVTFNGCYRFIDQKIEYNLRRLSRTEFKSHNVIRLHIYHFLLGSL